jgi:hypothetical protein
VVIALAQKTKVQQAMAVVRTRSAMIVPFCDDVTFAKLRSRTAIVLEGDFDDLDASGGDSDSERNVHQYGTESLGESPSSTAASDNDCVVKTRSAMVPAFRRMRTAVLIDDACCEVEDVDAGLRGKPRMTCRRKFCRKLPLFNRAG